MDMQALKRIAHGIVMIPILLLAFPADLQAQGATKWVAIGELSNWYSEVGCEIEHGNFPSQQYGLRWPSQYNYQDMQAAKGLWIGATSWTDERGTSWPIKVVHVGPRVDGISNGEFFPLEFKLIPKFSKSLVIADGLPTFSTIEEAEDPDPSIPSDRILYTKSNTALGVTMERKVYAWSQPYHDDYHILEFTFTNTGNIDGDADIEFPNQTVTGLYFYWQERYSLTREIRYMVNNSAGWGINTMNDARGFPPDISNPAIPAGENDVKAQFAWHGFHNQANKPVAPADFDNIGAPIWNPGLSAGYIPNTDTTWRLGSAQFCGKVHIYADQSATNKVAATNQPSTTNYVASDEPITRNNDQFNAGLMSQEYARMSAGHTPRHAWLVTPDGNFSEQKVMGNIGDGGPGGWSTAWGYGPYTLGPGESVKVVFAEGANGLTREEAIRIGKKYRDGVITTKAKNDSVLITGKERLLETFRRAVANYDANFNIPATPLPPASVTVASGGDRISISWVENSQTSATPIQGYRVYRAEIEPDSTFHLIHEAPPGSGSFDDVTAIRGRDYYYYVSSYSATLPPDPTTLFPGGVLQSSRFYTQTYDPANLKRPAGTSVDNVRIVPNPYNAAADQNVGYFQGATDRIAFLNIPGQCTIRIYTELGELVKEIEHTNGTGDEFWNSVTSSNQVVVSGVYIVHITVNQNQVDATTGAVQFTAGQKIIKKLIIIR